MEAHELVPGDLVRLYIGDRVPADIRIIETADLKVNFDLLRCLLACWEHAPAACAWSTLFAQAEPQAQHSSMQLPSVWWAAADLHSSSVLTDVWPAHVDHRSSAPASLASRTWCLRRLWPSTRSQPRRGTWSS